MDRLIGTSESSNIGVFDGGGAIGVTQLNARVAFVEPVGNAVDTSSINDHSIFYPSPDLHYCYPIPTNNSSFTSSYPSTPSSFVHESPCLTPAPVFYEQANAEQQQIYEEIVRECEEIERWSSSSSNTSVASAQNRNAALRYREKKRLDKEKKLGEIAGLTRKNQELKLKVQEISSEIAVLKKLMVELNVRFK
ncbi:basic region leucine zipper [Oesophagostomum dentatum]|uniref:Basic region leucine zipper n=1 Tax=Oesophagostomum dentatum TaxID=61180 RepID=A0A0B1TB52_OESDE|nr:basic region leucine zipper [Oesophagostomum dentatum]